MCTFVQVKFDSFKLNDETLNAKQIINKQNECEMMKWWGKITHTHIYTSNFWRKKNKE